MTLDIHSSNVLFGNNSELESELLVEAGCAHSSSSTEYRRMFWSFFLMIYVRFKNKQTTITHTLTNKAECCRCGCVRVRQHQYLNNVGIYTYQTCIYTPILCIYIYSACMFYLA